MKQGPAQATEEVRSGLVSRLRSRIPTPVPPLTAYVVTVPPGSVSLPVPHACACCGAAAAEALAEAGPAGRAIIVPYCTPCHFHATSIGTRRLSLALSASIVGLALLVGLPLIGWPLSVASYGALVAAGAIVPVLFGRLDFRGPEEGHTCRGRAAWWSSGGQLVCTHPTFAAELAVGIGQDPEPRAWREPVASPAVWSVALLPVVLFPLVYHVVHPAVRIVNLTPSRITVLADGRQVASLGPTSQESARAGAEVRLLAGTRLLRVIDADGAVVDERPATVGIRTEHLYTPGAEGVCFWLEHTAYGRAREAEVERIVEPIGLGAGFWAIERAIDTWFLPNPTTGQDGRSTGGELTALRQAPCLEAPLAVRNLMVGRFGPRTFAPSNQ